MTRLTPNRTFLWKAALLTIVAAAFVVTVLTVPGVQAAPADQTSPTPAAATPTPAPTPTPVPTPEPTPTVQERNRANSGSNLPIVPIFLGIIFLSLVLAAAVPFLRNRLRR